MKNKSYLKLQLYFVKRQYEALRKVGELKIEYMHAQIMQRHPDELYVFIRRAEKMFQILKKLKCLEKVDCDLLRESIWGSKKIHDEHYKLFISELKLEKNLKRGTIHAKTLLKKAIQQAKYIAKEKNLPPEDKFRKFKDKGEFVNRAGSYLWYVSEIIIKQFVSPASKKLGEEIVRLKQEIG